MAIARMLVASEFTDEEKAELKTLNLDVKMQDLFDKLFHLHTQARESRHKFSDTLKNANAAITSEYFVDEKLVILKKVRKISLSAFDPILLDEASIFKTFRTKLIALSNARKQPDVENAESFKGAADLKRAALEIFAHEIQNVFESFSTVFNQELDRFAKQNHDILSEQERLLRDVREFEENSLNNKRTQIIQLIAEEPLFSKLYLVQSDSKEEATAIDADKNAQCLELTHAQFRDFLQRVKTTCVNESLITAETANTAEILHPDNFDRLTRNVQVATAFANAFLAIDLDSPLDLNTVLIDLKAAKKLITDSKAREKEILDKIEQLEHDEKARVRSKAPSSSSSSSTAILDVKTTLVEKKDPALTPADIESIKKLCTDFLKELDATPTSQLHLITPAQLESAPSKIRIISDASNDALLKAKNALADILSATAGTIETQTTFLHQVAHFIDHLQHYAEFTIQNTLKQHKVLPDKTHIDSLQKSENERVAIKNMARAQELKKAQHQKALIEAKLATATPQASLQNYNAALTKINSLISTLEKPFIPAKIGEIVMNAKTKYSLVLTKLNDPLLTSLISANQSEQESIASATCMTQAQSFLKNFQKAYADGSSDETVRALYNRALSERPEFHETAEREKLNFQLNCFKPLFQILEHLSPTWRDRESSGIIDALKVAFAKYEAQTTIALSKSHAIEGYNAQVELTKFRALLTRNFTARAQLFIGFLEFEAVRVLKDKISNGELHVKTLFKSTDSQNTLQNYAGVLVYNFFLQESAHEQLKLWIDAPHIFLNHARKLQKDIEALPNISQSDVLKIKAQALRRPLTDWSVKQAAVVAKKAPSKEAPSSTETQTPVLSETKASHPKPINYRGILNFIRDPKNAEFRDFKYPEEPKSSNTANAPATLELSDGDKIQLAVQFAKSHLELYFKQTRVVESKDLRAKCGNINLAFNTFINDLSPSNILHEFKSLIGLEDSLLKEGAELKDEQIKLSSTGSKLQAVPKGPKRLTTEYLEDQVSYDAEKANLDKKKAAFLEKHADFIHLKHTYLLANFYLAVAGIGMGHDDPEQISKVTNSLLAPSLLKANQIARAELQDEQTARAFANLKISLDKLIGNLTENIQVFDKTHHTPLRHAQIERLGEGIVATIKAIAQRYDVPLTQRIAEIEIVLKDAKATSPEATRFFEHSPILAEFRRDVKSLQEITLKIYPAPTPG